MQNHKEHISKICARRSVTLVTPESSQIRAPKLVNRN